MEYDKYCYRQTRASDEADTPHWFAKLLALVFLLLCMMLGIIGVILPILPGIVFFGFAALIAAWLFPPLHRILQRQAMLAPYLDNTRGFTHLRWRQQARVLGWVALKMLIDSFRLMVEGIARLISFASRSTP